MRNFTGYMRDCERHKVAPSVFQLLLFLYHSDMVLTPPFWTPVWFLVALHHFFAYWVGAGLLGLVRLCLLRSDLEFIIGFVRVCWLIYCDLQVRGELPRVQPAQRGQKVDMSRIVTGVYSCGMGI